MTSEIIGRTPCPECEFHAAHVKIKTDKDGAQPYRHCPACGAQFFTRNRLQADNLRKRMRPEGSTPPAPNNPESEGSMPAAPGAQTTPRVVPVEPDQKYKIVLGVRIPV